MKKILLLLALLWPSLSDAGPSVRLTALGRMGFAPLTVAFTVRLEGTDEELWCPEVVWRYEEGRKSSRESDCEPWSEGSLAARSYTSRYTYRTPGIHEAEFQIRRNGRVIARDVIVVDVKESASGEAAQ